MASVGGVEELASCSRRCGLDKVLLLGEGNRRDGHFVPPTDGTVKPLYSPGNLRTRGTARHIEEHGIEHPGGGKDGQHLPGRRDREDAQNRTGNAFGQRDVEEPALAYPAEVAVELLPAAARLGRFLQAAQIEDADTLRTGGNHHDVALER